MATPEVVSTVPMTTSLLLTAMAMALTFIITWVVAQSKAKKECREEEKKRLAAKEEKERAKESEVIVSEGLANIAKRLKEKREDLHLREGEGDRLKKCGQKVIAENIAKGKKTDELSEAIGGLRVTTGTAVEE